jgi:hypothetical protein
MALHARVEYLRREQKELLGLAGRIEAALTLASQKEVAKHEDSLAQLRALEPGFQGIAEHCHSEERIVESTFHAHASKKERVNNDEQHREILRKLGAFRDDLRFATVDRLHDVCVSGNELTRTLRAHVASESAVLNEIVGNAHPARTRMRAVRNTSRVARPRARSIRKPAQVRPGISYLLEDHPEL